MQKLMPKELRVRNIKIAVDYMFGARVVILQKRVSLCGARVRQIVDQVYRRAGREMKDTLVAPELSLIRKGIWPLHRRYIKDHLTNELRALLIIIAQEEKERLELEKLENERLEAVRLNRIHEEAEQERQIKKEQRQAEAREKRRERRREEKRQKDLILAQNAKKPRKEQGYVRVKGSKLRRPITESERKELVEA